MIRKILFLPLLAAILFTQQTALAQKNDSDMLNLDRFRLYTDQVGVVAGHSIDISVQVATLLAPLVKKEAGLDDLLAPLAKDPAMREQLKQPNDDSWTNIDRSYFTKIEWEKPSIGTLEVNPLNPIKVVFKVPASTKRTTVQISARITGLKDNPKGTPSKMLSILSIPITIIEDQYVIFSIDKTKYIINNDGKDGGVIYHVKDDEFSFRAGLNDGMELFVKTEAYAEGSYVYKQDTDKENAEGESMPKGNAATVIWKDVLLDSAGNVNQNRTYSSSYLISTDNCTDCETAYPEGEVTIQQIEEVGSDDDVKITKAEEAAIQKGTASRAVYEKMARQVFNYKTTYVTGRGSVTVYNNNKEKKEVDFDFRVRAIRNKKEMN